MIVYCKCLCYRFYLIIQSKKKQSKSFILLRRWQRTADCKEPLNVYEDISCCWIGIGWILEWMRDSWEEEMERRWQWTADCKEHKQKRGNKINSRESLPTPDCLPIPANRLHLLKCQHRPPLPFRPF